MTGKTLLNVFDLLATGYIVGQTKWWLRSVLQNTTPGFFTGANLTPSVWRLIFTKQRLLHCYFANMFRRKSPLKYAQRIDFQPLVLISFFLFLPRKEQQQLNFFLLSSAFMVGDLFLNIILPKKYYSTFILSRFSWFSRTPSPPHKLTKPYEKVMTCVP